MLDKMMLTTCMGGSRNSLNQEYLHQQKSQSALCSPLRWSRKYDVFVCHSCMDSDNEEAGHLVSFLEASPYSLRCFLRQRDDCPGSAISTELCQAVQDSHIWALLITPNFLQDEWCKYMMHQVLAEGPMSNRIIPLIQNLSHSQYPQELKFFFYINLSHNPERAYTLLSKTVLKYFEDLVKNQKTVDCNISSPSNRLGEEDSSQKDKMMTQADSDGTTIPFSVVTNQTDGSFSGVS
ncbi:uncharacterized protein V6R79_023644 [Siganus canaliculatus]